MTMIMKLIIKLRIEATQFKKSKFNQTFRSKPQLHKASLLKVLWLQALKNKKKKKKML